MSGPEGDWTSFVAMCRERGLLAKQFYVVHTKPTGGMDAVFKNLAEHLAYQGELERTGVMFAAGPLADDKSGGWAGEGMVIIRAKSLAEARAVAEADPMHKAGARNFTVRPWLMNEGSFTVRVNGSSQKVDFT
jgi:uncharacterized protein YciI